MFNQALLRADLNWLLASPELIAAAPGFYPIGTTLPTSWLDSLNRIQPVLDHGDWSARQPFRLGSYAELLLGCALRHLPDYRLLAQQLRVMDGGRTVGEFDYLLASLDERLWHIELAVKFYLMIPAAGGGVAVGPGLRDALPLKFKVLQRQLALATTPAGRAALPVAYDQVLSRALIRGRIFYPVDEDIRPSDALAAGHLRGWWQALRRPWPQQRADSCWRVLPRQRWLAAQPLCEGQGSSRAELAAELARHFAVSDMPQMVAEYAPHGDGGDELARGFIVPDDWPRADRLAALMSRINPREHGDA